MMYWAHYFFKQASLTERNIAIMHRPRKRKADFDDDVVPTDDGTDVLLSSNRRSYFNYMVIIVVPLNIWEMPLRHRGQLYNPFVLISWAHVMHNWTPQTQPPRVVKFSVVIASKQKGHEGWSGIASAWWFAGIWAIGPGSGWMMWCSWTSMMIVVFCGLMLIE